MKRSVVISLSLLAVSLAFFQVARSASSSTSTFSKLARVSSLELPPTAAQLVLNAPSASRAEVAAEVIRTVAALSRPGMTPYVVSAICRATPDLAATVVSQAALQQPNEVLAITRAALNVVPQQTEAIVAAVCLQAPQSYAWVAVVADQKAPSARREILNGISSSLPTLAAPLAQAQAYQPDGSMVELMKRTHELANSAFKEQQAKASRLATETPLSSSSDSDSLASGTPARSRVSDDLLNRGLVAPTRATTAEHGFTLAQSSSKTYASGADDMPYLSSLPSIQKTSFTGGQQQGPPTTGVPWHPTGGSTEVLVSVSLDPDDDGYQNGPRQYSSP